MDTPQDDPESFFQIGGIHGLPYVPWDGVGEASQAEASGYCTHGSVLFPTWHRPYVALYEVRYQWYRPINPVRQLTISTANSTETRHSDCQEIRI